MFVATFGSHANLIDHTLKNISTEYQRHDYSVNDYEKSLQDFLETDKEHYFLITDEFVLTDENTLDKLVKLDKDIVAPKLSKRGQLWSNFWGAIDENGFYKRSEDYVEIVSDQKRGCFKVPYITGAILIKRETANNLVGAFTEDYVEAEGYDMCFCKNMRKRGIEMYVDNTHNYGYMLDEEMITRLTFTDKSIEDITVYSFFDNKVLWEEKYLHSRFKESLTTGFDNLGIEEVCGDVFLFSLLSETFCNEIVDITEKSGLWSDGSHNDVRVGGYENHPTVDIHMNQLGLDKIWEEIIKQYIAKVASHCFSGYQTKRSNICFVVKYDMNGQRELGPHHDSSAYTANVALNTHGEDYTGGGCKFIRQNTKVVGIKKGYVTIHPGRLTHYHEGLHITSGTRYILVSFIN